MPSNCFGGSDAVADTVNGCAACPVDLLAEQPELSDRRSARELLCSWAVGWVVGVDDFVAGVGFDDDVAAVVDVVVAKWAGQTHGVDVGESAVFPRHDVMDFASFRTSGAARASAVPVAGDDRFDLSFGCVAVGTSHPDGLSFTVKHNSGNSRGTHQTFQHCLRQRFTPDDLSDPGRVVGSEAFNVSYRDELCACTAGSRVGPGWSTTRSKRPLSVVVVCAHHRACLRGRRRLATAGRIQR